MKTRALLVVVIAALALQAQAEEKKFAIDAVHSSVQFKVRHLYSTLVGRFNNFSGEIVADLEKGTINKVNAEVDILSVYTANEAREKHLLNADFFDSTIFPKATFESVKVAQGKDGKGKVEGKITIKNITKDITFEGRFMGYGEDHRNGNRAGFHAVATIDRSDFGITYNHTLPKGLKVLGESVEIELNLEVVEVQDEKTQKGSTEVKDAASKTEK